MFASDPPTTIITIVVISITVPIIITSITDLLQPADVRREVRVPDPVPAVRDRVEDGVDLLHCMMLHYIIS